VVLQTCTAQRGQNWGGAQYPVTLTAMPVSVRSWLVREQARRRITNNGVMLMCKRATRIKKPGSPGWEYNTWLVTQSHTQIPQKTRCWTDKWIDLIKCADKYKETRINFYKVMAVPTFTYGSEIWTINRTGCKNWNCGNEIFVECSRLHKKTPNKYTN
jgi:hypothetical protein